MDNAKANITYRNGPISSLIVSLGLMGGLMGGVMCMVSLSHAAPIFGPAMNGDDIFPTDKLNYLEHSSPFSMDFPFSLPVNLALNLPGNLPGPQVFGVTSTSFAGNVINDSSFLLCKDLMCTPYAPPKETHFTSSSFTLTLDKPVPLPAAVWLFGSGLLGLVGLAKRRARTLPPPSNAA